MIPSSIHASRLKPSYKGYDTISNGFQEELLFKAKIDVQKTDLEYFPSFKIKKPEKLKISTEQLFSFSKSSQILKAGEDNFDFPITLKPLQLANGDYEINFYLKPKVIKKDDNKQKQTGSKAYPGVSSVIKFSISDTEIKKLEIQNITSLVSEESLPPGVNFDLYNKGNVLDTLDKVILNLVDKTDSEHVYQEIILKDKIQNVQPQDSINTEVRFLDSFPGIGRYILNASFFHKGNIINEYEYEHVEIFPDGTYAQNVDLNDFKLLNDKIYKEGDLLKLSAKLLNTGEKTSRLGMSIEIILDGETIDLIKLDTIILPKKNTKDILETYKVKKSGNYIFRAFAEYGVKKTNIEELSIIVGPSSIEQSEKNIEENKNIIYISVLLLILLILIVVVFFIKKKNKNKNSLNNINVNNIDNDFI